MKRQVLTIEEGSKALGLSRGSMYKAVHRGDVPALRIGRRMMIPRAALSRLLSCTSPEANIDDDDPRTEA